MNSLKGVRVLFFMPHGDAQLGGVFASQVMGFARYIVGEGAECLIFHCAPDRVQNGEEIYPHLRLLNLKEPIPHTNVLTCVRYYESVAERYYDALASFKPTHIYTRHANVALGARKLAKRLQAKLIYSMRGPDAHEMLMHGGLRNRIRALFAESWVRRAVKACDIFSTLSTKERAWALTRYKKDGPMIPCCVEDCFFNQGSAEERRKIREELDLKETDKVAIWCGGYAIWQRLPDIVQMMRDVCKLDETWRVVFIARHAESRIKQLCDQLSFSDYFWRALSLDQPQVPEYLRACDIGINVLTLDDLHSETCSPVKIGEYLSSGLPVLISRTMGDMPEIITHCKVGEVLDDVMSPEFALRQMEHLLTVSREDARTCAKSFFSWESHRDAIVRMFS